MNIEQLRARFEELAYQRYLELTLLAGEEGDTVEVLPKEALFARNPDDTYHVLSMNSAWWGFQAGAGEAPAAVQVVVPPLDNAPGGESAAIFADISEIHRAGTAVAVGKMCADLRSGEALQLPGLWEQADLSGGATDCEAAS